MFFAVLDDVQADQAPGTRARVCCIHCVDPSEGPPTESISFSPTWIVAGFGTSDGGTRQLVHLHSQSASLKVLRDSGVILVRTYLE
jgi:hypothetical protein